MVCFGRASVILIIVVAMALLAVQYVQLTMRNDDQAALCAMMHPVTFLARRKALAAVPPPPPVVPPPTPPLPPLHPETDACNTFEHTEMAGGSVVGGGSRLKLDNASACCAACQRHNNAVPRPRGRVNCTTWVYNMADASHPQSRECWLKRHDSPWADIGLLAGGARSWTTGIVGAAPPKMLGQWLPTARSCADDRWKQNHPAGEARPLYLRPATPGVHAEELSLCAPVKAAEASVALQMGVRRVRLRLNSRYCPRAAAWIDSLLASGSCSVANRSRSCAPHCCNWYRAEAAVGVQSLPETVLRAHKLDPSNLPHWGRRFWWGVRAYAWTWTYTWALTCAYTCTYTCTYTCPTGAAAAGGG